MVKIKKFLRNAAFSVLGVGLMGMGGPGDCGNWQSDLERQIREESYTSEQAEVLAAEGIKQVFTDKVERDDGTVIYEHNYDIIKSSEILGVIKEMHTDIKEMLDFGRKNIPWLRYLQNMGRGEHLKKQEKIYKYKEVLLSEKELHRKFKKLVGESGYSYYGYSPYGYGSYYYDEEKSSQDKKIPPPKNKVSEDKEERYGYGGYGNHEYRRRSATDQFKISEEEKYSIADIFPVNRKERVFDTDTVKKARKRGDFKDSKKIVEEILTKYEFFEKVENPQYIVNYGEKKWFFKKRIAGLRIISYNLDNDKEKKADYIEVFRFKKDGKTESKPAVKVFTPSGSSSLEVIVADFDFEGEGGYGMPDYVGRHYSIETARDLMENSELLDSIFKKKKEEEKREWPELKEMNKVYIVEAGTLPMTPYDCKNSCWEKFLPEYKVKPSGKPNLFTIHVRRDIPDKVDEEDKHLNGFPIKWIALEYNSGSRVVEFYKPKKEFENKKLKVNIIGRSIEIEDENGRIDNYNIQAVIKKEPYRIDFDRNYQKRWEVLDKDNDGKCYECKRVRARPSNVIPKR